MFEMWEFVCMKNKGTFRCCICGKQKDIAESVPRPSGRSACEECMGEDL